ncbi:MAG TPA: hypothetical protein VEY30_02025, partial [Myxococcaceae bacterium]|nr:hypothetical protein [Myxococcaceae bacterium]
MISPPTVTLADGTATATFTCEAASAGCAGNVRVVGKWNDTSGGMVVMVNAPGNPVVDGGMDVEPEPDAGTPIAAGPPVSIGWVSSKCGGQDCRLLGIKGSGINEQAQISFLIEDANNVPVRGVDVTFALIDDPKDTKLQAFTAKSNSLGIVTARVVSGPVIGAFSVTASVASPALSARSSSIGVRGAKPSNAGFNLQCEKVNLPVYTTAQERRLITLPCTVGVTDRYNNPVGTGTSVLFKTEAGNITNEVATVAYDPEGTNATEGTAPVVFNTGPGGIFPPVDVEPLAAATQWPFNQTAEPQRTPSGADPTLLVYNPRDQLVTVLAYVQGEEHFWDDNQNGIYDAAQGAVPAERF